MTEGRSDFEILSSGFERAYVGGSYFNPPLTSWPTVADSPRSIQRMCLR